MKYSTKNLRPFRAAVFALVASVLFLASCGSDQTSETSTSQEPQNSTANTSVTSAAETSSSTTDSESIGNDTEPSEETDDPDESSNRSPILTDSEVEQISTGYRFTEGPAWNSETGSLLFTDIPNQRIVELDSQNNARTFADRPGNGIIINSEGQVVLAGDFAGDLVVFTNGGPETIADGFENNKFSSPNDLVELVGLGYFMTDPSFNLRGEQKLCEGIYFVSYRGDTTQVGCSNDDDRPNGIVLSPDNSKLYVSHTFSGEIYSWDVDSQGMTSNKTLFATVAKGTDGMVVDAAGNIFITTQDGVDVLAPDGSNLGLIKVPEKPSNVTIGGTNNDTLFITAQSSVYSTTIDN